MNYCSPRLRLEAKPQLKALQASFQQMTTALLTARRNDATQLAVKLDNVTASHKKAEKAVKTAEDALELARQESEAKDAIIARLQALAAAGSPRK